MKKQLYIFILLFVSFNGFGQLPFLEDFESGSGGFSTDKPLCNDGSSDYFTISNGTDMNGNYTGNTGNFFAAQDINDSPCNSAATATITFSNIDITGCSNLSLSIDLAEDNPQNKWDVDDFFHIDVSIDGGATQNIIWVENDGATFNTAPQIDTDYDGNGDGTALTSAFTNFSNAIAGSGSSLTITITMHLDSGDEDIAFDNLNITGNCAPCPGLSTEPTNESTGLTATAPDCYSGDISWTIGTDATNTLIVISTSVITGTPTDGVSYSANSNFGSGDILNAGEFVIYNGNGGTVTVTGLSENTQYFISTFSYNGTLVNCEENYLTGGNTINFTTMTGCVVYGPQITSIVYNSCNGTSEGTDEIFTFTSGSDPIDIDDITIEYPNNSDYCNGGGCGANTNLNNPTYVNDLNVMAGCTVFAYANPIPPNSDVMVFTGLSPTTVLDYSSQCGAANLPIYVIFNNNASTSGRFSNTDTRTLIVNFGNGLTDTVTYTGNAQTSVDGATVNFDAPGNASYFISTDCVYPLPVNLTYFKAEVLNNNTNLYWATESERNNNYFIIEKSLNGNYFFPIGKIYGQGNSTNQINYTFNDNKNLKTTTYYRLKQVDFDGKTRTSYPIRIKGNQTTIYYSNHIIYVSFKQKQNLRYTVNIYNLTGQLIHTQTVNSNDIINWNNSGFYIIEIPELQLRQKFIAE